MLVSVTTPRLLALTGLPGVGKSTVAGAIADHTSALVVSVDPIEDALHRSGLKPSFETGLAAYLVAEVVARGALEQGLSVVIDAANYVNAARRHWAALADRLDVSIRWVEVVCSDERLHRERLAIRSRGYADALELDWDAVARRRDVTEPWPWNEPPLQIDTAIAIDPQLRELFSAPAERPSREA